MKVKIGDFGLATQVIKVVYSGRRIYQYNEDDFRFKFWISTKLSNKMDIKQSCQLTASKELDNIKRRHRDLYAKPQMVYPTECRVIYN